MLTWAAVVVVLLAGLLYLGGGWYFAREIGREVLVAETSRTCDLVVVAVTADSVTLEALHARPAALGTSKVYGLQWQQGFGQVTRLLGSSRGRVVRALEVLDGPPPEVGDRVGLRKEAFLTPATAGITAREVTFGADGAALPAWFAPGLGATWAVLVHGKGATRTEMLRLMRCTVSLGLPSLDIAYRRDPEMGGGPIRFGKDEWPDVEAAVRYSLAHGAARVVLLACSSGAAISASFLRHSSLAGQVAAMVFDAPMLDLDATVRHHAAGRTLPVVGLPIPGSLLRTARRIAGTRFGLDARSTSYLDDTDWLRVPILVFHGTADRMVPCSITERLAAARPDLVAHSLVDGADHVESWNVMPGEYDREVRRFLTRHVT